MQSVSGFFSDSSPPLSNPAIGSSSYKPRPRSSLSLKTVQFNCACLFIKEIESRVRFACVEQHTREKTLVRIGSGA